MIYSPQEAEQGHYPQPTTPSHMSASQSESFSGPRLTESQTQAFAKLCRFVNSGENCFILRGYAGTGKTFLIHSLVEILRKHNFHVQILAPTGRAAVTVRKKTGYEASTIHSSIYRYAETTAVEGNLKHYFDLGDSSNSNTIYIVDESSMISDIQTESEFMEFGSGRLLNDLIQYSKILSKTTTSKIIFIGDSAQLPPVNSINSPALDPVYLNKKYDINADGFTMTDVVRQAEGSDILNAATQIRENISKGIYNRFKIDECQGSIRHISPKDILSTCITDNDFNSDTIIIAYKNSTALQYNKIIRADIFGGDGDQPVCKGDRLIVIQNSRQYPLVNGDFVQVVDAAHSTESRYTPVGYGEAPVHLVFRDVRIKFKSSNDVSITVICKILDTTLWSKDGTGGASLRKALYIDFSLRHPELKKGSILFKEQLSKDPYFNALHVKFGYAITCHKAQGGEWANTVVIFDNVSGAQTETFFRWAYTAVTRCRKNLYLIQAPSFTPFTKGFSKSNMHATAEHQLPLITKSVRQAIHTTDHVLPSTNEISLTSSRLISTTPTDVVEVKQNVVTVEDLFKQQGITVTNCMHLQYKERYCVERGNEKACIDFNYNKKEIITTVTIVLKLTESLQFSEKIKETMLPYVPGLTTSRGHLKTHELGYSDDTIVTLREQLTHVLRKHFININYIEKKDTWHYRVFFIRETDTACIDFYINKKNEFSKVTRHETLGNSPLLLEETYLLLESLG